MPEEIKDLENETLLQIKTTDGKTRDICIGFTKIASPKMKEQITEAIREIDAQEIAGITITYVMEHGKKVRLSPALIGITVVSIILCMLFLFYEIRQRKRIRQSEKEQMNDSQTGIGNGDYLTYFYNNYIGHVVNASNVTQFTLNGVPLGYEIRIWDSGLDTKGNVGGFRPLSFFDPKKLNGKFGTFFKINN